MYEQRRRALLESVVPRLLAPDGARASMRELAAAADASVPTMRLYFGSREGVVVAAFGHLALIGRPWLERASTAPPGDLRASVDELLRLLWRAWERGVGRMVACGLEAGLGDARLGVGYVEHMLEPLVQAVETRLATHAERGQMRRVEPRFASIVLLSPILFALLHQESLGGRTCRPLDVDAFVAHHVDRFVAAYGPEDA